MLLWLATIVPGESPHCGKDHQQLRWVTADDVAALSWLTGDRQIIPTMQRLLTR